MASKVKNQPKKAPKKKNGYEMPKPLKPGDILNDNQKNQWKVGVSIGVGGFGEIYSACKVGSNVKKVEDYPFVIKIEPKENGPLFVEMHFYMRNAKLEDIETFKKSHKLKALGMPEFIAMGSHEIQEMKHRFIVLPRFGRDIWKIFQEQKNVFPLPTVYRIGWQILNVLEYIHKATYVHGDIKGSNILLGFGKGGEDQVYLLDFGLACHYSTKDFKPDPKKMHNGTIEYTSCDAHLGVPTMRGDIEILAYNLIEWAGAKLPWVAKNLLSSPAGVQKAKEEFVKTYDKSLKACFGSTKVPAQLTSFFKYLSSMNHDTEPDFAKLRGMLETGIKELGSKNSGKLEFSGTKSTANKKEKEALRRPDFNSKFGESPAKVSQAPKAGPSKKPDPPKGKTEETIQSPPKRGRGQRKTYAEVDSDADDETAPKKRALKKRAAAKVIEMPETPEDKEVSRPPKRNREKQRIIEESESENEFDVLAQKSPVKKSRKSPARSASKENKGSPASSVSPPQKKTKNDDKKKEKPSKTDDGVNGTSSSVITMKSKDKSSKAKKTIHLNFNLDVSMNSDVVVVVNRKDKKKKDEKANVDDEGVKNSDENGQENSNRAGFYKGKAAKTH